MKTNYTGAKVSYKGPQQSLFLTFGGFVGAGIVVLSNSDAKVGSKDNGDEDEDTDGQALVPESPPGPESGSGHGKHPGADGVENSLLIADGQKTISQNIQNENELAASQS